MMQLKRIPVYQCAIALFLMLLVAAYVIARHTLYMARPDPEPHDASSPGAFIAQELFMLAMSVLITVVISVRQRRHWLDYGLRAPHMSKDFLWGCFCGISALTFAMAALVLAKGVTITYSPAPLASVLMSAFAWMVAFVLVALTEELLFRGHPYFLLASRMSPAKATALVTIWFGLAHVPNDGETPLGILQVVVFGLVCCLSVWRTGALWWALGMHTTWDWAQSFLFGCADSGQVVTGHWLTTHANSPGWLSGGATGPEGSVLIYPALALLLLIVSTTLPPRASSMSTLSGSVTTAERQPKALEQ